MNEYKVHLKLFHSGMIFKTLAGESVAYEKAESATQLKKQIDEDMEKKYGFELEYEGYSYTIDITKI